jgi:hypothetical protein
MEEMKWSNSGLLGMLAARQCQEGMTGPKSDTQSIHNLATSLIVLPIWKEMKWSNSGLLGVLAAQRTL